MEINKIVEIIKETDHIFFDEKRRSDVSEKGENDFVTRVDTDISKYLHARLKREYPEVSFLSEEEGMDGREGGEMWILDPVDGTTNFMRGLYECAVSLGFCRDGEIVAGVIYIPYTGEMFYAQKGCGAYLNGKRIFCKDKVRLAECLGLFEFNAYFKNESNEAIEWAEKIFTCCQDIRTFGSAAVEMAYVACGRADVFLGRNLKPWDYAAGSIIISEAGGKVGRLGGEIDINRLNSHIIAANKNTYEDFSRLISRGK